ncbi:putative late blight resistance protein homolog R1B-12 [Salvia splendens]|uniref:putative late blight resistance protein homolog R1B-12 n=1 Tax=Salvia splendens TaxID=180675 RepID=UPI001C266C98|nr:putative late blight resistance protein homolog R1B-12 [Salvia splendens]
MPVGGLFCQTVFGEEAWPLELEDVGKKNVNGCKGLPLSIAVIGGLLSKSERTKESWGFFENLEDNESCLQAYSSASQFSNPEQKNRREMAAYGALVSVMHIIDQIQTLPSSPISIDQNQVESLTLVITSLQKFLESYSPRGGYTEEEDVWESRIAEYAYLAEDVIESYIADQIRVRSEADVEHISSFAFYIGLENVIENMNFIKIEIDEKMVLQDQLHIVKSVSTAAAVGSSGSASAAREVTMVGFDDVLYQMLDKITGDARERQILPIVGMGGIGKTTLARKIYVSPLVQQHFDVCAWTTISQEYNAKEILRQVHDQVGMGKGDDLSEDELGDHLHKYLFGRKYFIVMDDMWTIEAWDGVRRFFPDKRNGSRIVVTTRLSNLSSHFNYFNGLVLKLLDEDAGWNLFSKTVFEEESCPPELEDIGKKIVRGCKGLPLSVVVIGGLLSKSERTKESWGLFEKDLSSIVNSEDNERCLQILYMSYNNVSVHLKPCFLYFGRYAEDEVIRVSELILDLCAEGFVKPINGKSLEEAAEKYVEELVDRNLLIVEKLRRCGKLKSLKMHDLLRDVCLREARKLKFLYVLEEKSIPKGIYLYRRIASRLQQWEYPTQLIQSLKFAPSVRSFFGRAPTDLSNNFRLLRISMFEAYPGVDYVKIFLQRVNMRLLVIGVGECYLTNVLSSISFLWNLQTVIIDEARWDHYCDIWKVPQLRHVKFINRVDNDGRFYVPVPRSDEEDMVMENLQSLYIVYDLKFCAGVLKRIPNIKKLKLCYQKNDRKEEDDDDYQLDKICCLHKLEYLTLESSRKYSHWVRQVSFPCSLTKLTLEDTNLPWEDMKTKIGPLPLLQVLKLKWRAFIGSEWETLEDQFSNLKFLLIETCDVECWITENTHFPRLEHLHLRSVDRLREIPSCMGDIPTLLSIKLSCCCDSVVDSVRIIKEEQQELGNEDLQIVTTNKYYWVIYAFNLLFALLV